MSLRCSGRILRRPIFLAALLLVVFPLVPAAAASDAAAASAQPGYVEDAIGKAVLVLTGPWKFHPGDDMAWAQPGFDDSSWSLQDLAPPAGSYDPITGSSGFVPGWTTHGYPKLTGYAWYRLHVRLKNPGAGAAPPALALTMPINFDDAYQVYVNGRMIGQYGRFKPNSVVFYNAQPRMFPLPDGIDNGVINIAIRLWMDVGTPFMAEDAGGLHGPPLLGEASAVNAMLRLEWDAENRTQIGSLVVMIFLFLATVLGFALYWLDRNEPAYLWLGAACIVVFAGRVIVLLGYYSMALSMASENVLLDVILNPLSLALWALFWAYWFNLENIRRIARITWILTILLMLGVAMIRPPLYGYVVPAEASSWIFPITVVLKLSLGVVLLWVTYRGIRKRAADGWLALAPIVLTVVWAYQEELTVLHVPTILSVSGLTFSYGTFVVFLMLAIVSILMMRRFIRGVRERQLMQLDIEQARHVQQFLIPEAIPNIRGFSLESEYRPAQEVGGDFFQILPVCNGSVLVVIGDVSGKGTPAAMTVSLLVGAVRTLTDNLTQSPGEILAALNRRVLGRSDGGFTTCLVLRADPDGTLTIANAGHLSPYIRHKEVAVESGLALGLSADSTYPESTLRLAENEQLTLLTDGVVEARSKSGELFGFDRTAAITGAAAQAIVQAAQQFGQEDDITVLTLMRLATA